MKIEIKNHYGQSDYNYGKADGVDIFENGEMVASIRPSKHSFFVTNQSLESGTH